MGPSIHCSRTVHPTGQYSYKSPLSNRQQIFLMPGERAQEAHKLSCHIFPKTFNCLQARQAY
jgi:hypothetical protein